MNASNTIAIVGSGLAGVTAAGTLRDAGFAGRILLIGDEAEFPYDRPPLSKAVLVHDEYEALVAAHQPNDIALRAPANIALRPEDWYQRQQIELLLGVRATGLDTGAHFLTLADGRRISYDRLLLAPGARVRRLPAIEQGAAPHLYLRTLRDAVLLRRQLSPGRRVVLLGGGVIGMEVAASAVLRDCDVTVAELAPRIMARALPAGISEHVAAYHLQKGVKLRLGAEVAGPTTSGAPGLALRNGDAIPADVIVIGIGVVPDVELALAAGLLCQDGIVVDEFAATSAPDVYAVGDAVHYPDAFFGRAMRSENWTHAQNQAAVAARNMLGAQLRYEQIPYMWSDQYDLKIQVTGRIDAKSQVLRGSQAGNKFMLLHMDESRVVGATGINMSRDINYAQRLIEARVPVDTALLADSGFNLKKAIPV